MHTNRCRTVQTENENSFIQSSNSEKNLYEHKKLLVVAKPQKYQGFLS